MGAVKNAFHDEICAAADDQRADEFDCYEARLHSLLSDLDWLKHQFVPPLPIYQEAERLQRHIKEIMK